MSWTYTQERCQHSEWMKLDLQLLERWGLWGWVQSMSHPNAVTHVLQLTGQRESIRRTVEPVEEIESATVVGSATAWRIHEEFECVTESGETIVITGTAMMDWTIEVRTHRKQAVMKEDERKRAWYLENYSRRVNNLSFREQMNVLPYQLPSASDYGTPTMPNFLRMYTAIQSYPRAAKNMSFEQRLLRENESLVVKTMKFKLNS